MGASTYVRFVRGDGAARNVDKIVPMIYLHWGGPPELMAETFDDFFAQVEVDCGKDTRYSDPEYLAAKFVVFSAANSNDGEKPGTLDFLSVGVAALSVLAAIRSGAFTYAVDCSRAGNRLRPTVLVDETLFAEGREIAHHSVCTIEEYIDAQHKNAKEEEDAQLV